MSTHDQFYQLIFNYPDLAEIWNQEDHTYDPDAANHYLRTASAGEVTVLKCLISIWKGGSNAATTIDFTDLATLDPTTRQPLIDWLSKPFFP